MNHQHEKDILLDQALDNQIPADALDSETTSLLETASQVHAFLDETPPPPHGLRPGRSAFLTAAAQQPAKRKGFLFFPFPLLDVKRMLGWSVPIVTVAVLVILLGTAIFSSNTAERQLPPEQTTSAPAVIETVQQRTAPPPTAEGIEPDIESRGTLTPNQTVTDDEPLKMTPHEKQLLVTASPAKADNSEKSADTAVETVEPAAATATSASNAQNSPPPNLNNPPAALPTAVVIVAPSGITITSPLSLTTTITPPPRVTRPRNPRPPRVPRH